jgi:hypothetical protein
MNKSADTTVLPHWLRTWEQFWFTPADPSLLGLIRIATGMIVVYTLFAYSFSLPELMGEYAWQDMKMRMNAVRNLPVTAGPFAWTAGDVLPPPKTPFEADYLDDYQKKFRVAPPPPYPNGPEQALMLEEFRLKYNIDLRINGLPIPQTAEELEYAESYTKKHNFFPPPAYARNKPEADAIDDYIDKQGADPRRIYARGMRIFSLWFHVLDPNAMAVLHTLIVVCAFLFMLGFCTRLTSALTWFGSIGYIHRNPTMVFGVDTMMTILLLYLMIGPSGAAFSVDNVIRRWWARAKPGVVQGWYRLWRRPVPGLDEIAPPVAPAIVPSVAANVALRLLQIHVCIIYFVAGISKLQGPAWWTGEAVWGTLGNFEFAPMQLGFYLDFLAFIGQHRWLYTLIMTGGGLFTLAFEIGYAFLIWRPRLRWVFLGGAIILHGFIGLFMGLKTFSLIMLVMNMAFLRKEEVYWLVGWFGAGSAASTAAPAPTPPLQPAIAATALKQ